MDDKAEPLAANNSPDPHDLTDESHPFVIKVWLEEKATATSPALWRGHISHAYTRRRQHIQSLEEISDFIRPYIAQWQQPYEKANNE